MAAAVTTDGHNKSEFCTSRNVSEWKKQWLRYLLPSLLYSAITLMPAWYVVSKKVQHMPSSKKISGASISPSMLNRNGIISL